MKQNFSDQSIQIKLIRESMETKETAELLDIYSSRGTDEWTELAYEVVRNILLERNVVLNENIRRPILSNEISHDQVEKDDSIQVTDNVPVVFPKRTKTPSFTSGNYSVEEKHILEQMDLMETEELVDAYIRHDPAEWTNIAFSVMERVLAARNVDVSQFDLLGTRPIRKDPHENHDALLEYVSEKPPLDLSRINWQEDSVDAIYYELCKRTLTLKDLESTLIEQNPSPYLEDDHFNCVHCNTKISWSDCRCPQCGLELYPEGLNPQGIIPVEQENIDSKQLSELALELETISTHDLLELWFDSDPMEWTREEMTELRSAFEKRGILPMYMLDAPADLIERLPYLSEEGLSLRGWPGYRNRPGRCGLDPLDRNAEEGFIVGKMLLALFTLKFRTTNGFYITLMLLFGVILTLPIISLFTDIFSIGWFFLPYILVGIMLLLNTGLNVFGRFFGYECSNEEPSFFPPE